LQAGLDLSRVELGVNHPGVQYGVSEQRGDDVDRRVVEVFRGKGTATFMGLQHQRRPVGASYLGGGRQLPQPARMVLTPNALGCPAPCNRYGARGGDVFSWMSRRSHGGTAVVPSKVRTWRMIIGDDPPGLVAEWR
jgi:hypothetical protein